MKKIILLAIAIGFQLHVNAQNTSVSVTGGYATNGIGFLGNYNMSLSQNSYLHIGAHLAFSKSEQRKLETEYRTMSLNIGYFYNAISSSNRRFNIGLGGGIVGGYEDINNGNKVHDSGALINSESKIIYGLFVGTDWSYRLSDNFSLTLVAQEYYHDNSDLGSLSLYAGLGFRYHIN